MNNLTRPLEFRAWHTPSQRMCYGVLIDPFNPDKLIYIHQKGTGSHFGKDASGEYTRTRFDSLDLADCVLMQFSGCFDPAGVKVFEGDILRFDNEVVPDDHTLPDGENYSSYHRVIYANGCFCGVPVNSAEVKSWEPFYFYEGVSDYVLGNQINILT